MPTYYVRRTYGLNAATYPELWHDSPINPTTSKEHGKSIKMCHVVTKELMDQWEQEVHGTQGMGPLHASNGRNDGLSLLSWLALKWPEPKDVE